MALTIATLQSLNQYIKGVMDRADEHGEGVNEVILTLAGAVIWKAAQGVEVRTYQGETANLLWLIVGGNRYVLAYNHKTRVIELRNRTQRR